MPGIAFLSWALTRLLSGVRFQVVREYPDNRETTAGDSLGQRTLSAEAQATHRDGTVLDPLIFKLEMVILVRSPQCVEKGIPMIR
jgi:hypothetical protein